jgi:hypothetical protein
VKAHAAAGDGILGIEWVSTSPVGAMQKVCAALAGLISIQRLPRVSAASRPPPWAVQCRPFSARIGNSSHYQYICFRLLNLFESDPAGDIDNHLISACVTLQYIGARGSRIAARVEF